MMWIYLTLAFLGGFCVACAVVLAVVASGKRAGWDWQQKQLAHLERNEELFTRMAEAMEHTVWRNQ